MKLRLWWSIATVIVALLVVFGGYAWWSHERLWTLNAPDGRRLCRVQAGWNEQELAAHCGTPSGRGTQPKVPRGDGFFDLQMCSAPGYVYGAKVVFYGCHGTVTAVEEMPTGGFIYPN